MSLGYYLQSLWNQLDFSGVGDALLRLAAVFLCLTIHETCHGLAAYALGDPTARQQHRLSLNPLRHIDWIGLACMFFLGFGWAKPVPVNPNYFRNPKRDMALTALAGPVSNLLLAILLLLLGKPLWISDSALAHSVFDFLLSAAVLSIGLGIFNLIPFPPLDGSKVLAALLPDSAYRVWMRYERFGMLVLLLLAVFDIGSGFLSNAIYSVFSVLVRVIYG